MNFSNQQRGISPRFLTALVMLVAAGSVEAAFRTAPVRMSSLAGVAAAAIDLAATKTDSADPAAVGSQLTYFITASNNGPDTATDVLVKDILPASVNVVSMTASQGSCTRSGVDVTCAVGTLVAGQTVTVQIVVVPTAPGPITNFVIAKSLQTDSVPANNSAAQNTEIVAAPVAIDLAVTKTDSADPATVGSQLTYFITARNNGPDTATDVLVKDNLPASVTVVSMTPSQGTCTRSGVDVTCAVGALAAGQTVTVQIVVIPTAPGSITNFVLVKALQNDTVPANNSAAQTTLIVSGVPQSVPTLSLWALAILVFATLAIAAARRRHPRTLG